MPILYHGSNTLFEAPDLTYARDKRDFGVGFYTTTHKEQATEWATNVSIRYGGKGAYLYTFELDLSDDFKIRKFPEISIEWLELVKGNRMRGGIQHDFDVVIGPVANDNTFRTIALYVEGTFSAEEAMTRLRYSKANDQVSLHTPKVINALNLIGREQIG
jgi:hypothetical protein